MLKIMANYILFCSDTYHPSGGALDIVGLFDDLQQAIEAAKKWAHTSEGNYDNEGEEFTCLTWAHIYNIQQNRIMWHRGKHMGTMPENAENQ
jgi:hypothetical protein